MSGVQDVECEGAGRPGFVFGSRSRTMTCNIGVDLGSCMIKAAAGAAATELPQTLHLDAEDPFFPPAVGAHDPRNAGWSACRLASGRPNGLRARTPAWVQGRDANDEDCASPGGSRRWSR